MLVAEQNLLLLFSLADSAFPIGSLAHSYGLETLVLEEAITVSNLAEFLPSWCSEALGSEAIFFHAAYALSQKKLCQNSLQEAWIYLNAEISAFKPAREGRLASLRLGGRFLRLAVQVAPFAEEQRQALMQLLAHETHYVASFAVVAGYLAISCQAALLAFLNQGLSGLISAAQRLLPLGQLAAMELIFKQKPLLLQLAEEAAGKSLDDVASFMPFAEIAGMQHPYLQQRMFLS